MPTCKVCGALLTGRQKKYCSEACRRLGTKHYQHAMYEQRKDRPIAPTNFTCAVCGAPLPPHRAKYCSDECRKVQNSGHAKPAKACKVCGKPLPPGRKRTYCSDECQRIGNLARMRENQRTRYAAAHNTKPKACPVCGRPVSDGRRVCCSDECRQAATAAMAKPKASPKPKPKTKPKPKPARTLLMCKICGAPLTGHQRAYCAACAEKYPHWYDRQMLAQPPEAREAFDKRRKQRAHDKYVQKLAGMLPEQMDAYHAHMREYARAYYARKTSSPHEHSGNTIARRRIEAGMTQSDLASELGTSPSLVSKFENGHAALKIDMLIKISQALNCTVEDLLDSTMLPE